VGRSDVRAEDDAAGASGRSVGTTSELDRALAAFQAGEPVAVHDADDREGEVDLLYPAGGVDADAVARLRNDAGGLVCVALSAQVADAAGLPYLTDAIDHPAAIDADLGYGDRPSFSVTVNHHDTFTGITDEDRARTISALAPFADDVVDGTLAADDATDAFASSFRIPGHVHLLRAAPELLAERRGHTELAVAMARAAEIPPAVVVCEMLDDASGDALPVGRAREYASRTGIPFLEGDDVVAALSED